jgi:hypothetical protein
VKYGEVQNGEKVLPRLGHWAFPPTLGCLGFTAPRKRSAEAETTPPKLSETTVK